MKLLNTLKSVEITRLEQARDIHNLKGGVGPFKIFHVGKMEYTIERDGRVLDRVENISRAYRSAERLNEQRKREESQS